MHRFIIFFLFLTGCSKVTYQTPNPHDEIHIKRQTFFLYGLIGDHNIDLKEVCPHGVSLIQQRITGVDFAISFFTLALVNPLTVEIRCQKRDAHVDLFSPDLYPLIAGGDTP